jgi:hypothetical protein
VKEVRCRVAGIVAFPFESHNLKLERIFYNLSLRKRLSYCVLRRHTPFLSCAAANNMLHLTAS